MRFLRGERKHVREGKPPDLYYIHFFGRNFIEDERSPYKGEGADLVIMVQRKGMVQVTGLPYNWVDCFIFYPWGVMRESGINANPRWVGFEANESMEAGKEELKKLLQAIEKSVPVERQRS